MPKIKVKNIPSKVVDKFCDRHIHCIGCILHLTTMTNGLEVRCMRDQRIEPNEKIITLSEKDFPTNREWLESLSNFELAALMTSGYTVKDGKLKALNVTTNLMTDINEVTEWFSQPCAYLMEEE